VLALSGSFAALALTSAITRLLVYAGTCASVLALRRQGPAPFTIPLGPVVPILALALSVAILYGASRGQLQTGAYALAIGAVLYLVARAGGGRR
jgi:amino acid transporter